ISDAVTLTVSAKIVLSVSPQNCLTEGDSVTLSCEVRNSSTEISRGTGGTYSISPAALRQTGLFWCSAERGEPAFHTKSSNIQHLLITVSSPSVSLIVSPSRSQHFSSDSLSLICEKQRWGSVTGFTCSFSSLSITDTGVYWCESESGGSSNPVTITVHSEDVILESPVHLVTEGDPLTLRCLYRNPKSSYLTTFFYKDDLLLQTSTTEEMIIPTVSKSDEGLYHCKIPEKGKSPQSWISIRGASASEAPFSELHLLSFSMAASPYLLATIILGVKCYRARGENHL
uniref:Ig-like domain-containing protein n=1 Tax=Astyanax mexicanus TaxID=7994 RepID=A0A3B1JNB3_ASTMX